MVAVSPKDHRLSPWLFMARYILIMALLLLTIGLEPVQRVVDINGLYTKSVVWVTARLLSLLGLQVGGSGSIIQLPGIALDVRFGCNGLEAVFIYGAALLAYPAPWRRKGVGFLAGLAAIQLLNLVRIAVLGMVGVYLPGWFHLFHIYVAQGLMIGVALVLFLGWLRWVGHGA